MVRVKNAILGGEIVTRVVTPTPPPQGVLRKWEITGNDKHFLTIRKWHSPNLNDKGNNQRWIEVVSDQLENCPKFTEKGSHT